MKSYLILLTTVALIVPLDAEAASFDCKKASNRIDSAICASAEVSRLDGELSEVYAAALRVQLDPDEVKTAQRAWLRDTRNKCQDEACLVGVYEQRIAALEALAAPSKEEVESDDAHIPAGKVREVGEKPEVPPTPQADVAPAVQVAEIASVVTHANPPTQNTQPTIAIAPVQVGSISQEKPGDSRFLMGVIALFVAVMAAISYGFFSRCRPQGARQNQDASDTAPEGDAKFAPFISSSKSQAEPAQFVEHVNQVKCEENAPAAVSLVPAVLLGDKSAGEVRPIVIERLGPNESHRRLIYLKNLVFTRSAIWVFASVLLMYFGYGLLVAPDPTSDALVASRGTVKPAAPLLSNSIGDRLHKNLSNDEIRTLCTVSAIASFNILDVTEKGADRAEKERIRSKMLDLARAGPHGDLQAEWVGQFMLNVESRPTKYLTLLREKRKQYGDTDKAIGQHIMQVAGLCMTALDVFPAK